eukprot:1015299_1
MAVFKQLPHLCVILRRPNHYRYFSSYPSNTNVLMQDQMNQKDKSAQNRKTLRGDGDVIKRLNSHQQTDYTIKQLIDSTKSWADMQSILTSHVNAITHVSTYAYAMKSCNKRFPHTLTHSPIVIMETMIHSSITPDTALFGIFFNCLARANLPHKCMHYVQIMIDKYQLEPNIIIFNVLIKGCRYQSMYSLAQQYWKMMHDYNVTPDEKSYTEMISVCARSHQQQHANELFAAYLNMVDKKKLTIQITTFSAYLNVFCCLGDSDGMENVLQYFSKYELEYDTVVIGIIMDTYNNARNGRKALQIFDEFVDGERIKVNDILIKLKCVALRNMMTHDALIKDSYVNKQSVYDRLVDTIFEYDVKGQNRRLYSIQLSAAITLYHDQDPMQIVRIFEEMVEKKHIGYLANDDKIDLHLFSTITTQFILRYLIGFKAKDMVDMNASFDRIVLITGKGKGNEGEANLKHSLKAFIQKELLSYDPPIRVSASKRQNDTGVWIMNKSELIPYMNDDENYAKQKLIKPSTDWCFDDPRIKLKHLQSGVIISE